MSEKIKVNAYINEKLAEEFRQAARISYGQIGLCLSAAMVAFLEMESETQIAHVKRVFEAEEDGKMDALIAAIQEKQRAGSRESKRK